MRRLRLGTRSALVITATVLSSSAASAASSLGDNASAATAALKWTTRQSIPGPTSNKLGGSTLQVQVGADLDPLADTTKPLVTVDMPKGATVEARWNNANEIELTALDAGSDDATFKVEHTLAPHIKLFINAFGFNLTYDYTATSLLGYVPGSKWTYVGQGQKVFEPWGLTPAILDVQGPSLANAQLFSIPLQNIIGGSNPLLEGTLALNATTEPKFNYKTTEIRIENSGKLDGQNRTWRVPTTTGDFIEVPVTVKGLVTWTGNLLVRPSVTITKIGTMNLPFALVLDVAAAGVELPYESGANPIVVNFPVTSFHIPLPNVHAPKSLDVGSAELGKSTSKGAEITNTGELTGSLVAKSSDPQFVVTASKLTAAAKDKVVLDVKFTPTTEGIQTAEIEVTTNDPNEPVQIIKVTGTGARQPEPPAAPEAAEPEDFSRPQETGCGCRTTPSSSDALGLGVLAAALGAIFARRRRA